MKWTVVRFHEDKQKTQLENASGILHPWPIDCIFWLSCLALLAYKLSQFGEIGFMAPVLMQKTDRCHLMGIRDNLAVWDSNMYLPVP